MLLTNILTFKFRSYEQRDQSILRNFQIKSTSQNGINSQGKEEKFSFLRRFPRLYDHFHFFNKIVIDLQIEISESAGNDWIEQTWDHFNPNEERTFKQVKNIMIRQY